MGSEPKRRVILHPKTALARRHDRARAFGGHVRGYTVDTDDVLGLVRSQRRLSVRLLLLVLIPVAMLPLLFRFVPSSRTVRVVGSLPLPWLVLGPVVLFAIVLIAAIHERRASAIEDRWADRRSSQ